MKYIYIVTMTVGGPGMFSVQSLSLTKEQLDWPDMHEPKSPDELDELLKKVREVYKMTDEQQTILISWKVYGE